MITTHRLRSVLVGATAVVLAATTLAACGSGASDDSAASDGSSAGFPVKVATKFGDVEIKTKPTRVVALGWGDAETALALGVQPVGASDWLAFGGDGVGPWAKSLYKTKPKIIATLQPDYEAVAALKPDLILDTKSSGDKARYERLTSIATTVDVPRGGDNYLTDVNQQVTMVSQALGVPDKGKQVLASITADFAAAAKANPEFKGKTITAAAFTSEGWGAYVKGAERSQFLTRLGFTLNPKVADVKTDEFSIDVSTENLDQLDADVLVTFPIYIPASKITSQAAYQALPVVQQKHAIVLDDKDVSSAFSLSSALSIPYAIENMVPLLQKAAA